MIKEKAQAIPASGIVPAHAEIFSQLANDQDIYILSRNLNPLCTSLIADNYPTKGMSVHGKSSDWGPQAGFICVDQNLSKYCGHPRVPALNAEVKKSLRSGSDVEAIPLAIKRERLDELRTLGLLIYSKTGITNKQNTKQTGILITTKDNSVQFFGVPTSDNGVIFRIFLKGSLHNLGDPVMVIKRKISLTGTPLTDDEKRKPLTADYDLFNVCPSWKNVSFSGADKFSNIHSDLPEFGSHRVLQGVNGPYAAPAAKNMGDEATLRGRPDRHSGKVSSIKYESGKAIPVLGHTTIRQDFIRRQLNTRINATYKGGDTVHHGAEVMNPSPESDDFSITVFCPKGAIYGLQNVQDLNSAYWMIKDAGYFFHVHPLWKWRPATNLNRITMKLNVTEHVKPKGFTESEKSTRGRHL